MERQAERLRRAEKDRPSLIAQTRFLGGMGVVFLLPVIGGAYLGLWLDSLAPGYSVRWTAGLIFLGVVTGAVNVYFFVRE
ncbi:MAG: AtpZ/AtpI family protein [Bryobacteraceae bacterium]